jgi:hypothetical protein
MDYESIKQRLAPCGLHCGKCFAFKEGAIREYSGKLKAELGNFDAYAGRFVHLLNEPVFEIYPDFKSFLSYLSAVDCRGCRKENCKLFGACKVRSCHEKQKVDFCFECAHFPCQDTGFDENLYKRSVAINQRMKEIGVGAYYEEIKNKPRY